MYVCRLLAHDKPCHMRERYFDPSDVPCMTCFYCDYYPDMIEDTEGAAISVDIDEVVHIGAVPDEHGGEKQ